MNVRSFPTAASLAVLFLFVAPLVFAQPGRQFLFSGTVGSGARALGMGGAFIAIADDATAASWNPAGLCVLQEPEGSIVWQSHGTYTLDWPSSTLKGDYSDGYSYLQRDEPTSQTATTSPLEFASFTYPVRVGSLMLVPQVNYHRVVDFGRDESYEVRSSINETEPGNGSRSYVENYGSDLNMFGGLDVVAASLGIGVSSNLYFGVAVNRWHNGQRGSSTSRTTNDDPWGPYSGTTNTNTDEQYSGTNFNIGLLVKPSERIQFGVVAKSAFTMDYDYRRSSTTVSNVGTSSSDTTRDGQIRWPWTFGAGVAILPTDFITFSMDFTTTGWSNADVEYTEVTTRVATTGSSRTTSVSRSRQWPSFSDPTQTEASGNPRQVDTRQIRFGFEYVIKKPGLAGLSVLPLRAGLFFDRQLFKDRADLDDVTFSGVTGGFGFVWSHVSLDFAYVFVGGQYKCCDYQRNDGSGVSSYLDDANDVFSSHRFYMSSTVRF